jgi:hypothetical protein
MILGRFPCRSETAFPHSVVVTGDRMTWPAPRRHGRGNNGVVSVPVSPLLCVAVPRNAAITFIKTGGSMTDKYRAVTADALAAVIERHKLEPVSGEYQITKEMIAEAAAIDEARGDACRQNCWRTSWLRWRAAKQRQVGGNGP